MQIGLLIGGNCPKILEPLEMIPSQNGGPYAFRSVLGWCVAGPITVKLRKDGITTKCNRITVQRSHDNSYHFFNLKENLKDNSIRDVLMSMYKTDFHETTIHPIIKDPSAVSVEDQRFLQLMDEKAEFIDGHYVLPLPLKNPNKVVPNNRHQAVQRAQWLSKRLSKNERMRNDYVTFMNTLLEKGYAMIANSPPKDGKCWYLPHHGVYHPQKIEKIRVVFDCSAQYCGYSLNNELMQGPDLTNNLVNVLTRFRNDRIAIVGDIESMFHQVRIPSDQRDYLRFVWWPGGDLSQPLVDFQMKVHLFGGVHSPSVANYALKRTAQDFGHVSSVEAIETLKNDFYVDDLLTSTDSNESAIQLLSDISKLCKAGGFTLAKYNSNSRDVLNSVSPERRAKSVRDIDKNKLPEERVLGTKWTIENDEFGFDINIKEKPCTRRGVLSAVSSVFDPLGIASPFILQGRKLLQLICSERLCWDDALSKTQQETWMKWKLQLQLLKDLKVPRCFRPVNFVVNKSSIHHFSDASTDGYGVVSYLRLVSVKGDIHCSFVLSKARVAPLKKVSIPRLELTAATTAVKVATSLRSEIQFEDIEEFFWTDSKVTLGYIGNETKRFHLFVSNRIQMIRDASVPSQWNYVPTAENPADIASRGLCAQSLLMSNLWLNGPDFLWKERDHWPNERIFEVSDDDPEVKKIKVTTTAVITEMDMLSILETRISSWIKMKRVVARMLSWRYNSKKITVKLLQRAEQVIIKWIQRKHFDKELVMLSKSSTQNEFKNSCRNPLKQVSHLYKLDPFVDNDILRVGGRLRRSQFSFEEKHPILLPRQSTVTKLIIIWCHQRVQHGGRGMTLNEIRRQGFWIVNAISQVRFLIQNCVRCRLLRGKVLNQKMADLPADRLEPTPPFTYCAVDMFGPFHIKERRKTLKRYGAMFTCLASRGVHIESTNSLDTDSFIQALRRFISRRGQVRSIRCDNGTNFVGAENELQKAMEELDQEKINNFLLSLDADWIITWRRNPPAASHFGGVWERQIRSARAILSSLMLTHGHSLDDESFRTLLTEVEAVINSRPLTTNNIDDVSSPAPLSPMNILTAKSNVVLPPAGIFQKSDLYCRRKWRRIQHLCNEFWSRWRKEYLQTLQTRQKWQKTNRNLMVGDVVIIKDDNVERNNWLMGRVIKLHKDDQENVRSVELKTQTQILTRPISKTVLLLESPTEEPLK